MLITFSLEPSSTHLFGNECYSEPRLQLICSFLHISCQSPLCCSVMHAAAALQTLKFVLCKDGERPRMVQGYALLWMLVDEFLTTLSAWPEN